MCKNCKMSVTLLLIVIVLNLAEAISLLWDKTDNATGYVVYYGDESGNYDYEVDVGTNTVFYLSNIKENKVYYFAVKAYNEVGIKGKFSEELRWESPKRLLISDKEIVFQAIMSEAQENAFTNGVITNRYYALERKTNLNEPEWEVVKDRILANNQEVRVEIDFFESSGFYRVRYWDEVN